MSEVSQNNFGFNMGALSPFMNKYFSRNYSIDIKDDTIVHLMHLRFPQIKLLMDECKRQGLTHIFHTQYSELTPSFIDIVNSVTPFPRSVLFNGIADTTEKTIFLHSVVIDLFKAEIVEHNCSPTMLRPNTLKPRVARLLKLTSTTDFDIWFPQVNMRFACISWDPYLFPRF